MLIISNNLIGKMPIPREAIIRINLAWIKSFDEAKKLIKSSAYPIYLDYPSGRTKPPVPVITLEEAIDLAKYPNVKYFAVSNCETAEFVKSIQDRVTVEVVPKIETEAGVRNIKEMKAVGIKTFMLDKDDLWISVDFNKDLFDELLEIARSHIKILELQGVVFI